MGNQAQIRKSKHSLNKQTSPGRRRPRAARRASDATLVHRLLDHPAPASTQEIQALQRTVGNQATTRFIQAKLRVGPAGDRYEREADRIAREVMTMPDASTRSPVQRQEEEEELQAKPIAATISPLVQRQEEEEELQLSPDLQRQEEEEVQMQPASDGGFSLTSHLEADLENQKGRGTPLPKSTRTFMEPRFGADFGGVRVHAGSDAAQISRQINAKAFTHGQDIYFGAGMYQPKTDNGKQLLAHELTHVVQQTGSAQLHRQTLPISHTSSPHVQRLISRENFVRLAGNVTKKARFNRSTYLKILKALDTYPKVSENEEKKEDVLETIIELTDRWLGKHDTHKKKDLRKDMFMEGLQDEARAELSGATLPSNSPSAALAIYEQSAEDAEEIETNLNQGTNAAKYEFSIVAAVDHPDYLDFAKKRLALTVSEKKKFWKKNKSNSQIKEEAARHVVETKHGSLTNEQKLNKIEELKNIGGEVGHAYVKLSTYDAGNKNLSEKSFGFWPLKYFPHPQVAIPGKVKYPDTAHDNDAIIRRRDFEISAQDYKRALLRVTTLMKSPPDYKLIDYNCTKFARDIAKAAGVNFPEKAYLRIPFHGLAWDPNSLYHELSKDEASYSPKEIREQREKELQDLRDVELALHNQYAPELVSSTVERYVNAREALEWVASEKELFIEDSESNGVLELIYMPEGMFYKVSRKEYDAFMKVVNEAQEAQNL